MQILTIWLSDPHFLAQVPAALYQRYASNGKLLLASRAADSPQTENAWM